MGFGNNPQLISTNWSFLVSKSYFRVLSRTFSYLKRYNSNTQLGFRTDREKAPRRPATPDPGSQVHPDLQEPSETPPHPSQAPLRPKPSGARCSHLSDPDSPVWQTCGWILDQPHPPVGGVVEEQKIILPHSTKIINPWLLTVMQNPLTEPTLHLDRRASVVAHYSVVLEYVGATPQSRRSPGDILPTSLN